MKKRMALVVLGIFLSAPLAWAASFGEFSAEMVSRGGGREFRGKIYVSGEKSRVEMPGSIMITRMDQKISWVIMPEQQMYMEHPLDLTKVEHTAKELPGEVERKSMGKEDVDGKPADKFLVRYDSGAGEQSIYQWMNADGFPVQVAAVDGSWSMLYQNLHQGPQPSDLFEIPASYQKMEMPNMGDIQAMMKANRSGE